MVLLSMAAGVLLSGTVMGAQQAAMCHGNETAAEISAPESLPVPVKMTGIGNSSMKIKTKNEEAQAWFTQGLNLLHDFWDYEAAKAFEQAVRSDPKCAMCYWGEALVLGPNINAPMDGASVPAAFDAITRARTLAAQASIKERALIEALAALFGRRQCRPRGTR